jgi:hypothetical protein
MSQNGKGDSPRPIVIDRISYELNWDAIFGKSKILQIEDSGSTESIQSKTPHHP